MEIYALVTAEYDTLRLDHFLKNNLGDDISRSSVQKWIRSGNVTLRGNPVTKTGHKVSQGEEYLIQIPARSKPNLEPVPMEIPVLWEDEHYLLVHKKPGIATHPGPGDRQHTLVNGLLYNFPHLSGTGGASRPGIVHRLDKPTEGVLAVAKNDRAHVLLAKLFQNREVEKTYYAWVLQAPKEPKGKIDLPIRRHPRERLKMAIGETGRAAITNYETLQVETTRKGRKFSLLKITPETGRTHQIRVHLASIHCPIVGDLLYSRSAWEYTKYGMLLLAKRLSFLHPFTGRKVEAEIEFPERFLDFSQNVKSFF